MNDDITFDDMERFLAGVPGFRNIPPQDLRDLIAPIVCISRYETGQTIIRIGDPGDTLFMLYHGRVRGELPPKNGQQQHFFLEHGEIFGEMALVSHARRSANIIAIESCICLTIDTETFQAIMKDHWRITRAVAGLIGTRLVHQAAKSPEPKPVKNSDH